MLLNQLSRALYEIRSTQKTNIYIYIIQMKRETNTISNIGKHMSYGVGSYIYAGV